MNAESAYQLSILLMILLQTVDYASTVRILNRGGRELNPLLRWAMTQWGVHPALIMFKIIFLAAIYYFYTKGQLTLGTIWAINCIYSVVAVNNLTVLRKLKESRG
jgi:hypothetical protein